jgi:hypothetical protein
MGTPPSQVTLARRMGMAPPFMAAGRPQVPSSVHLFIPERSIQGTGTTHGRLATVPGGVVLVTSDANKVFNRLFRLV